MTEEKLKMIKFLLDCKDESEIVKKANTDNINKNIFKINEKYFIRTVTYHFTGLLVDIKGDFLVIRDCTWIAYSGRFANAIKEGKLDEVEPIGDWHVNINSITDFGVWQHDLPLEQQ